ncbi:NADPH-dependent FMN reductase [Streptosporangium saharense]|uniref:NADPH-dependent FMN reductase n=1 Tax=Streptosporangium saharense TaxID=1706840 RepID=UPI003320F042
MSPTITDWVVAALDQSGGVEVDLVDLIEISLPDDSRLYPGGGAETAVGGRIEAAEAFVFVTPEYNHSYPASLKRLIDWHYREWMLKPATIVAYGVQGGHAAIEHLRGVLAELNMITTRRCMGLPAPWESLDDTGCYAPADSVTKALTRSLAELSWWSDVLTEARANRSFPA